MDNPILTIDKKFYIDQNYFDQEQESVLMKTWQFAGHISKLKNAGDYFTFEIAGQPLFCILDENNSVKCFYNVCKHRAHELLKGEGNCKRAANLFRKLISNSINVG